MPWEVLGVYKIKVWGPGFAILVLYLSYVLSGHVRDR